MLKLEIEQMSADEAYELLHEALTSRRAAILTRVSEIESQMSEKPAKRVSIGPESHPRPRKAAATSQNPPKSGNSRKMSPQARQNIIDAQKKRWAKVHREKRAVARAEKAQAAGSAAE